MTELLHKPVLEREVIEAFMEQPRSPQRLLEGTFGRGGHTLSLLKAFPRMKIVSFDRDAQAVEYAHKNFSEYIESGRLQVIHDDFRNLTKHRLGLFDGALFDLGVSSPQLDESERGFSFLNDGPLDMRMDNSQSLTASQIINEYSEKELSDIFYHWGEIRKPNRVVRAIAHDRDETPFETTRQLASLIERVDGKGRFKRGGAGGRGGRGKNKVRNLHPATNYFMALRIAVNQELEGLESFLETLPLNLEPASHIVVISFHSLEDRIAKTAFRAMNRKFGKIITKKVMIAQEDELKKNPRARSAKMRIFETGGVL